MSDDSGFFSRWSRRKAQVRHGLDVPAQPPPSVAEAAPPLPEPAALPAASAAAPEPAAEPTPPPPTLDEARALTPDAADFSRFVRPDVAPEVRHTALKTLFSDPHFNQMDGLDIYIDDYGRPDPLPAGMLRQLAQSSFLGLFQDDAPAAAAPAEPAALPLDPPSFEAPAAATNHEDPDLRLQPDDAAGCAGPAAGVAEDPGRPD